MSSSFDQSDLEKLQSRTETASPGAEPVEDRRENATSTAQLSQGSGWIASLQRFAGKYGVEQRGIERVPAEERTDSSMSKMGTIWLSSNLVISSFALGALSTPVFHLSFLSTFVTILFTNLGGALPVCFFSTFGCKFGLRQMVLSRFYFGYHVTNKMIALFNILACIGWSAVNVLVGAQLFHAINPSVPGWAGIIALAASTFVVTLFGYRIVHAYERFSWIPSFIVFLVVLGEFARLDKFDPSATPTTVRDETGSVLSFAASIFGFVTGWTSFSADYTVYQPPARSRASIFAWTFAGLFTPLMFTELLGAAVATATRHHPEFDKAYRDSGVGGLLVLVLVPRLSVFGEFCVIVLALSTIANNCPNIYSVSLTLQVFSTQTQQVPRFVWVLAGTVAYIAIAIPAYAHFESALEAFMVSIAYWLAIYEGICLAEHFFFRRRLSAYNLHDYNNASVLPPGWAALSAFCMGAVGVMLGMANKLYKGPIGNLCGGIHGGDVGFELGFVFASLSYIVFRRVEKEYFGR
ncbi:purine-cytosine permease [Zalerion maritima]|uniref:Purine-cytosine permease n=1 Tax=Zalerion maritima TaxID=339359 RepID=A0AAD5RY74_9PEZI|nr:purine-cytosine permease [Zalerion maritima]